MSLCQVTPEGWTQQDSTEHSLSQNNLLHWDGQQNLQPWAHSCPETALPVLSPGQSISAEFGASSRGRKRARRVSPTRQKTREGILEWKEERTERSYNQTNRKSNCQNVTFSGHFIPWGAATKILLPDSVITHQGRRDCQPVQGCDRLLQKVTQRAHTARHCLGYPAVSSRWANTALMLKRQPCSPLPAQSAPSSCSAPPQALLTLIVRAAGELIRPKYHSGGGFSAGSISQLGSLNIHTNAAIRNAAGSSWRWDREAEKGSSD